jgi:hypothetical protein
MASHRQEAHSQTDPDLPLNGAELRVAGVERGRIRISSWFPAAEAYEKWYDLPGAE